MVNVAIVEDEDEVVEKLKKYLERLSSERSVVFEIFAFNNAVIFLENYKPKYDIVLMDIEMPDMDGVTASRKLREFDPKVILVFVTNMKQLAVKGYEVDALDFIVKPVSYYSFSSLMNKAMRLLRKSVETEFTIRFNGGLKRICADDVVYIEVRHHDLSIHTDNEVLNVRGKLSDVEKQLEDTAFVRCNSCYLVNMKYVTAVNGEFVTVGGSELKISRKRKKEFMEALNKYLGVGIVRRKK